MPQHPRGDGRARGQPRQGPVRSTPHDLKTSPFNARARLQVDTDLCRSIRAAMGVPEANRGKGLFEAPHMT